MKIVLSLIAILMLNKDCKQNQSTQTSSTSEKVNSMQEDTTISYEETTRGFYERIWITKDSITVTGDRNHLEKLSVSTPKDEWKELMTLLNDINIQELPNLEAPTSMRHYDGARFTTLFITQNKVETATESFDHGHPPKAIEPLVNKVLSMRKLVAKK